MCKDVGCSCQGATFGSDICFHYCTHLPLNEVVFQAMEAQNEFGATLEQMLKDVKCDDELNKVKKVVRELKISLNLTHDRECANSGQLADAQKLGNQVVSLEARLRMIWNERKAALERVSLLEAQIENSSAKDVEDLRLASYEANKILADSYLDVL